MRSRSRLSGICHHRLPCAVVSCRTVIQSHGRGIFIGAPHPQFGQRPHGRRALSRRNVRGFSGLLLKAPGGPALLGLTLELFHEGDELRVRLVAPRLSSASLTPVASSAPCTGTAMPAQGLPTAARHRPPSPGPHFLLFLGNRGKPIPEPGEEKATFARPDCCLNPGNVKTPVRSGVFL